MTKKYIIGIDLGTTLTKVVVVDKKEKIICDDSVEIDLFEREEDGAILQNPQEIYETTILLLDRVFNHYKINPKEIDSIGITNQRETTILWDKTTDNPIYQAIGWQSKHTEYITNKWKNKGYEKMIFNKTGLKINPYFSASKIAYILEKTKPNINNILFGTIDSFIIWKLTNGRSHKTDVSNASRTMLFNIYDLKWDEEILNKLKIPKQILPEVCNSNANFGYYQVGKVKIPIRAVLGDQQAALFGHGCLNEGELKCTYGTGIFLLLNTGNKQFKSKNGLLTTVAWQLDGKVTYSLEGTIFICGAAIQWLRDELKLINSVKESESYALNVKSDNVYVVPAFVGLGTPYWDNDARGTIVGLTRRTEKGEIIKATLESLAYQVEDVLTVIKEDTNHEIKKLLVDGGASINNYLMQFQSDISNIKIARNSILQATSLGVCFVSGLKTGFWKSIEEIKNIQTVDRLFYPNMKEDVRKKKYYNWKQAVKAAISYKPK